MIRPIIQKDPVLGLHSSEESLTCGSWRYTSPDSGRIQNTRYISIHPRHQLWNTPSNLTTPPSNYTTPGGTNILRRIIIKQNKIGPFLFRNDTPPLRLLQYLDGYMLVFLLLLTKGGAAFEFQSDKFGISQRHTSRVNYLLCHPNTRSFPSRPLPQ